MHTAISPVLCTPDVGMHACCLVDRCSKLTTCPCVTAPLLQATADPNLCIFFPFPFSTALPTIPHLMPGQWALHFLKSHYHCSYNYHGGETAFAEILLLPPTHQHVALLPFADSHSSYNRYSTAQHSTGL